MTRYLVLIGISGDPIRGCVHIADDYGRSICPIPTPAVAGNARMDGARWTLTDKIPDGRLLCWQCRQAQKRWEKLMEAAENGRTTTPEERERIALDRFNSGKGIKGGY